MSEVKLYPADTQVQALCEGIVDSRIGTILAQYTDSTGEGGHELKDEQALQPFSDALMGLIKECEVAAQASFSDVDFGSISADAEMVVMRKALMYLSEASQIRELQRILGLSDGLNARIEKVLGGGSLKEMVA